MFYEAVPHPLSLLVRLGATGIAVGTEARWSSGLDVLEIDFQAETKHNRAIDVSLRFRAQAHQPRPAAYAIDGARVERVIEPFSYLWSFWHGGRRAVLADPLRTSVECFLARVRSAYRPEVDDNALHRNLLLLDQLWGAVSAAARITHEHHGP
jgi:hypothetical protein